MFIKKRFYIENLVYKKDIRSLLFKGFLYLLSILYRFGSYIRQLAFDKHFLRTCSVDIPVISVGNITAGGTGKTPLVMRLAYDLGEGVTCAVLSRGYISKVKGSFLLSEGNGPLCSAEVCGDEPYLFSKTFPHFFYFVGANRCISAKKAVDRGVQLIILDDGMQHQYLSRDIEIVVVDSGDPFGRNHFLPLGLLRQSPKMLKRADYVVLNHVDNPDNYGDLFSQIARYTKAPIICTTPVVSYVFIPDKGRFFSLKNRKVAIFCGIGQPLRFYNTVKNQLEADIVANKYLSDHMSMDSESLLRFAQNSKELGAEILLCTEKDFVKLPDISRCPLSIAYVKIILKITHGEEIWNQVINKTLRGINANR